MSTSTLDLRSAVESALADDPTIGFDRLSTLLGVPSSAVRPVYFAARLAADPSLSIAPRRDSVRAAKRRGVRTDAIAFYSGLSPKVVREYLAERDLGATTFYVGRGRDFRPATARG